MSRRVRTSESARRSPDARTPTCPTSRPPPARPTRCRSRLRPQRSSNSSPLACSSQPLPPLGPARSSRPSRASVPRKRQASDGGEERWPALATRRPVVVSESREGSRRLPRCACRSGPAARCEATRGRKGVARYPPLPPRSPGRPSAWTSGRRRDQPCSLPTNSVGRRVRRVDTPTARKAFPEASGQAQTPLPPRPRRPRPPNDTAGASTVYHQLTSPRVAPHAPQAAWPLARQRLQPCHPLTRAGREPWSSGPARLRRCLPWTPTTVFKAPCLATSVQTAPGKTAHAVATSHCHPCLRQGP